MITFSSLVLLALTTSARAYFLVGRERFQHRYSTFSPIAHSTFLPRTENILTVERADPIVKPGGVAGHVHRVIGGSNFGVEIPSSDYLRESECTTTGIEEDKSAYWFPQLYFEYADGTFELVNWWPCHLLPLPQRAWEMTTIFPDNFRMISGNTAQGAGSAGSIRAAGRLFHLFELQRWYYQARLPSRGPLR
jgi:hypothetical protein